MAEPLELSSSDNPRVKAVVRLREHKERRSTGQFVAEGVREVGRALEAGLVPTSVFYSPTLLGLPETGELGPILPGLARTRAAVYRVTPALLGKMAYCENPEGLLAVFTQPRWTFERLSPRGGTQAIDLWLVAVGTQKPGNLGAMARSASAAGATGLLVADGVVDAFNPNAIRASTGAV